MKTPLCSVVLPACWACGIEGKKATSGHESVLISIIIGVIDVLLLEMFL